jgi:predicted DNA-binding antitoxin AbrB/MazE fold protein
MRKWSLWLTVSIVGIVTLFVAVNIYAGTEVEDVIRLESEAYDKHKEGIAEFSHRKHQDEYREKNPELYSSQCGECHHDEDNKPLVDLKEGDDVQKCIECHKKADYIKGKKAKGLTKEQKREYHANAYHDNCKGCHKKYNKKKGLKSKDKGYAPNSCKTCHPKNKK